jgi:SAM-dependent methyltransferase
MNLESNKQYNESFYDSAHFNDSYSSAKQVAPELVKNFSLKSVVDLGCGIGSWLRAFKESGVKEVLGVDFNEVDSKMLHISKEEFTRHDLRKPFKTKKKFDLAISTEVAEHIDETYAENFIDSLSLLSDRILFSAAIPKQGGRDHVNERFPNYWVKKFEKRGFIAIDFLRPKVLLNKKVGMAHRQNMLFFVKNSLFKKEAAKYVPYYDYKKRLIHRTILIQSLPAFIRFPYRINNSIFNGLFNSFFDNIFLRRFFGDIALID